MPNGLCFSPDEKLLYINDTRRFCIRVYDVAPDGSKRNEAIFKNLKFGQSKGYTKVPAGEVDLDIRAQGDTHIDDHHTVEDIGITLGQAMAKALGDKQGIRRYGHAYVPLDEALSRVVIDFSGRPGLEGEVEYPRARIGSFDVDLFHEFFQGFVNHAGVTLHLDNLRGRNAHHIAETLFKAFGRALRMAVTPDPRMAGMVPSTKGSL